MESISKIRLSMIQYHKFYFIIKFSGYIPFFAIFFVFFLFFLIVRYKKKRFEVFAFKLVTFWCRADFRRRADQGHMLYRLRIMFALPQDYTLSSMIEFKTS